MIYLALGLALLALISISVLVLVRLQIKSVTGQLRLMRQKPFENMILRTDKGSQAMAKCVAEMNALLTEMRETNRQLETLRRSFSAQISSISHDLRTPLTSILGYIELAEGESDAQKRAEYLSIIRRRSQILQSLIVEFYDLSRIDDPSYQLASSLLFVEPILEDCVLTFYDDFEKNGLHLSVDIANGPKIPAAREALIRVYSNLLHNILKYGYEKAEVRHFTTGGRSYSVFSNFLPAEVQMNTERIFERFYTGDVSRSKQSTGLGLYIVRVLLEKMGHTISAKQEGQQLLITIAYQSAE